MDDCVDLALAKFSLTNVVYFNFTQMARLAGQNDITGRIRPVGRRLPDGGLHNLRMYMCATALTCMSVSWLMPAECCMHDANVCNQQICEKGQ